MKTEVFWNVKPCSLKVSYKYFAGNVAYIFRVEDPSKTFVTCYIELQKVSTLMTIVFTSDVSLWRQRSIKWKPEKLYKIRNMNIAWSKNKQGTVKGIVIWFGISLSNQFEENAVVCCLLACVCSMTTPDRPHTAALHTVKQIFMISN